MSGRRGGRGGPKEPLPRNIQISKKLSWLLRHGADEEGLKLGEGGFANLQDVLNNRKLRSLKATLDEILQLVQDNDKQRFTLKPVNDPISENEATGQDASEKGHQQTPLASSDPKDYLIRANQGHSIKVDSAGLLRPLVEPEDMPGTVIHGTTHSAWPRIVSSGGLKPMERNHVHFATGLPAGFVSIVDSGSGATEGSTAATASAPPVISGMRKTSTVLIYVDIRRAVAAGIKFWMSDNGVVLSEGNGEGIIPIEFFLRVEDRTGEGVLVEDGKVVKDTPAKWTRGKG